MHPGDDKRSEHPIVLPMFRAYAAMPDDMRRDYAEEAGLCPDNDLLTDVAVAIVHLLETKGQPPTSQAALNDLQSAAASVEHRRNRSVEVGCRSCNHELFTALIADFDTDKATVNGPQLIRSLARVDQTCPHAAKGYS